MWTLHRVMLIQIVKLKSKWKIKWINQGFKVMLTLFQITFCQPKVGNLHPTFCSMQSFRVAAGSTTLVGNVGISCVFWVGHHYQEGWKRPEYSSPQEGQKRCSHSEGEWRSQEEGRNRYYHPEGREQCFTQRSQTSLWGGVTFSERRARRDILTQRAGSNVSHRRAGRDILALMAQSEQLKEKSLSLK